MLPEKETSCYSKGLLLPAKESVYMIVLIIENNLVAALAAALPFHFASAFGAIITNLLQLSVL